MTQVEMGYDLYINSSSIEGRERFVRIYRRGEVLTPNDLALFERKYHRIYVSEHERSAFLSSLSPPRKPRPNRKRPSSKTARSTTSKTSSARTLRPSRSEKPWSNAAKSSPA